MARLVMGCPTARPQQEGIEDPDRDPQQEDQLDAAEGKDIADYDPDVDNVGSKPQVEPVAQDEWEFDPDAEYVNMEIPQDGTLHQRMMPWKQPMGILQVHRA